MSFMAHSTNKYHCASTLKLSRTGSHMEDVTHQQTSPLYL